MVHSFHAAVAQARRDGDLYFAALLSQDRILKAFDSARATWQGWVYTREEIARLYRQRWQAELHLRSLKTVLQMNHLRCKTPPHACNEFFAHLLGYNLIRGMMAAAASQSDKSPWEISFKGTLQTLDHFLPILLSNVSSAMWCEALLTTVAAHLVGQRPARFEPRPVKAITSNPNSFRGDV